MLCTSVLSQYDFSCNEAEKKTGLSCLLILNITLIIVSMPPYVCLFPPCFLIQFISVNVYHIVQLFSLYDHLFLINGWHTSFCASFDSFVSKQVFFCLLFLCFQYLLNFLLLVWYSCFDWVEDFCCYLCLHLLCIVSELLACPNLCVCFCSEHIFWGANLNMCSFLFSSNRILKIQNLLHGLIFFFIFKFVYLYKKNNWQMSC